MSEEHLSQVCRVLEKGLVVWLPEEADVTGCNNNMASCPKARGHVNVHALIKEQWELRSPGRLIRNLSLSDQLLILAVDYLVDLRGMNPVVVERRLHLTVREMGVGSN